MFKLVGFFLVCIMVMISGSDVKDATARVDQRSLLIIFDGTSSMGGDLVQLRSAAQEIINEFSNRKDNPIFNYILVVFRDPGKFK